MPDSEKVIGHLNDCMEASRRDNTWVFVRKDIVEDALALLELQEDLGAELTNAMELIHKKNERIEKLLKQQEAQKFLVDESGKITPLPVVVRCKDCIHRGKSEKCVLAAISEEKDYPLFMLDNRGEWYCADGKRSDT